MVHTYLTYIFRRFFFIYNNLLTEEGSLLKLKICPPVYQNGQKRKGPCILENAHWVKISKFVLEVKKTPKINYTICDHMRSFLKAIHFVNCVCTIFILWKQGHSHQTFPNFPELTSAVSLRKQGPCAVTVYKTNGF